MAHPLKVTQVSKEGLTVSSLAATSYPLGRTLPLLLSAVSIAVSMGMLYPQKAHAGIFDDFRLVLQSKAEASSLMQTQSVQVMPLPKPAMNIDPNPGKGGGDVTVVDGSALVPQEGPSGTVADQEKAKNSSISVYVVREGDTLTGIAHMFGVSANTIKWANDIPARGTIRIGQTLTILPVTGVKYTTKGGDTLASIAKKFGADAEEIANFNQIEGTLAAGTELIIPDGEIAAPPQAATSLAKSGGSTSSSSYAGYYMRPLSGGTRTQGVHGYNGVDIAAAVGTPVLASAAGEVIVAKNNGGWNGGYGNYVVIKHANGSQTLYAHESSVIVSVGQTVVQGQVIGYVGDTGKATGPHVHFEIRGGPRNPF